jgi:glycosyltransferase involved in cell wall biosynthesis
VLHAARPSTRGVPTCERSLGVRLAHTGPVTRSKSVTQRRGFGTHCLLKLNFLAAKWVQKPRTAQLLGSTRAMRHLAQPSDETVHIVEPGGRGGVYQSSLGEAIVRARDGSNVVFHTARDAEMRPAVRGLSYCTCMRWQRRGSWPTRATMTGLWVAFVLLPHLFITARRRGAWEVQGAFGRGAYVILIAALKARGAHVAFAPHNSFSRGPSRRDWMRDGACRLADLVIVYAIAEESRFPSARGMQRRHLEMYLPAPTQSSIDHWHERWGRHSAVVLFAGQFRPDKNPEVLVEAVARINFPVTLAFVGEDHGSLATIKKRAVELGLAPDIFSGYLPLDDFSAAIAAANIVVCPYGVASQSGVAAVARALNTPVIATDVGGLSEQATATVPVDDVEAVAAAIVMLLSAEDHSISHPAVDPPQAEARASDA